MKPSQKYDHAETIAFRYLLSNGYTTDDFCLGYGGYYNPDFKTKDGKLWEVKRIDKQGRCFFTQNQLYSYPNQEINVICVYKNDVLFVKSFSEIYSLIRGDKAYFNDLMCIIDIDSIKYKLYIKQNNERIKLWNNIYPIPELM